MLKRKKVALSVMMLTLLFLTACFGQGADNNNETNDINVTVVDKLDQELSATVELSDIDGKVLSTKKGSAVSFSNQSSGNYVVTAKVNNQDEEPSQTVIVDKDKVSLVLKFDSFASKSSVQKKIFEANDDKTITIKNLKKGENVILGVSPFKFDPSDSTSSELSVKLNRENSNSQNQNYSVEPMNIDNPEYMYQKPPRVNLPKTKSIDPKLRSTEQQLLSQAYSSGKELPQFGPNAYSLSDSRAFWYQNFETGNWTEKATTVKGVGEHCYVFVEDSITYIDQATIDKYVNEFDNNIYENNTTHFSDQFDIDGNNKLGIVILDMEMTDFSTGITLGYFFGVDFFSQAELDELYPDYGLKTNEGDFVYLNGQILDPDLGFGFEPEDHFGTIAHEFQHELWFTKTWDNGWAWSDEWVDDTWINEGMSTYAEQLNGYTETVDSRVYLYFDNDDSISQRAKHINTGNISLPFWSGEVADYGISNLFTNYVTEQFGEGILNKIYQENINPIKSVEDFAGKEFQDMFMDFMIANKLHSLYLAPEYSYDLPLEGDPAHSLITSNYSGYSANIRPGAINYYKIEGTGSDVTITISGGAAENRVGVFTYRY